MSGSTLPRLVLVLGTFLAACSQPRVDPAQWQTFYADPFSLTLSYPAAVFPPGAASRTRGDAQWMLGPNPDGGSLLIKSYVPRRPVSPYQAACAGRCSGEVYHVSKRSIGISAGHIAHLSYFSECRRVHAEMHCFHVIYPAAQHTTYQTYISLMHASFDESHTD